jgi:hypothetical protein
MLFLHSKKLQLAWAIWALLLGASLLFIHTLQHVHSFSEYLRAFIVLDMPSSWCPTFLILYGITSLLSLSFGKIFTPLARLTGLVLLPVGLYATYEFTFQSFSDPLPIYIYAQAIHVSEILTGLLTIFLLVKRKS